MTARVTLLTGPAFCGKTTRLLHTYRQALADGLPGECLWISPTRRCAAATRQRLLADGARGFLEPGVLTFELFANKLLQASAREGQRISNLMKRDLLTKLVRQRLAAGKFEHYRPIAHTSGFIDLICEWITELKRLEIWPEHFLDACEKRAGDGRLSAKDFELGQLYLEYQSELLRCNLYDEEGRFWWTRELLKQGRLRPFDRVKLVVADSFDDFTRTQYEVLELLSQRAEQMLITLPLEAPPRRDELFAKSLATLDKLQKILPQLTLETLPRRPRPDFPALSHLELELFKNPRIQTPAATTSGLEIIAASRELGEIETIGRRIKELLVQGDQAAWAVAPAGKTKKRASKKAASKTMPLAELVRPEDVVVVFRSLERVAPLVREVFEELGIPLALESRRFLHDAPAMTALVSLLRLAADDWPFRNLLAVLSSNYFQPTWPCWHVAGAPAAVERTLRTLLIPEGREALLHNLQHRLERLRQEAADESQRAAEDQATREDMELALPVLQRLAEAFAALPAQAGYAAWSAALTKLAEETGLLSAMSPPPSASPSVHRLATFDLTAWQRFQQCLAALEGLYTALKESSPKLDVRVFLLRVEDMLGTEELPNDEGETGRVRVLSAPRVRGLQIPYLFCAGLAEQSFPLAEREDRLYSDPELRQLSELGLPVIHRQMQSQDEMLLFYDMLNRATRRLVMSFPALDEKAQPLLPSPYLTEVQHACSPTNDPAQAIPVTEVLNLTGIPDLDQEPVSPSSWRVSAVHQALWHGSHGLLAGWVKHCGQRTILDSLETIHWRKQPSGFGPYEGILTSPAARQLLAERFGQRTWSPVSLERYQDCPFRFFLETVLGIAPPADIELETDYARRGIRMHDTLQLLHQMILQAKGQGFPHSQHPEFLNQFGQALENVLGIETVNDPLSNALREVDRRLLAAWGEMYGEQHQAYDGIWELDQPLTPAYFEFSFGLALRTDSGADARSLREPMVLTSETGEKVQISGRIDRVDLARLGERLVFNIIDYKTGRSTSYTRNDFAEGRVLQLPLYAMAVQELLLAQDEAWPFHVGYWFVKDGGFKDMAGLYPTGEEVKTKAKSSKKAKEGNGESWPDVRSRVQQRVFEIVKAVKAGDFPVFSQDETCTGRCEFHTVCRVRQVRSLEKTWPNTPSV